MNLFEILKQMQKQFSQFSIVLLPIELFAYILIIFMEFKVLYLPLFIHPISSSSM